MRLTRLRFIRYIGYPARQVDADALLDFGEVAVEVDGRAWVDPRWTAARPRNISAASWKDSSAVVASDCGCPACSNPWLYMNRTNASP